MESLLIMLIYQISLKSSVWYSVWSYDRNLLHPRNWSFLSRKHVPLNSGKAFYYLFDWIIERDFDSWMEGFSCFCQQTFGITSNKGSNQKITPGAGHAMRKHVFRHMWTAKTKISLRICTVWSGLSLSANWIIGYYRLYEWRAKAQMIFRTYPGWSDSAHVWRHFFAWGVPDSSAPNIWVLTGVTYTLKAPTKICSRRHSKIFIFQRKQVLTFHVNCLLAIHMKCQDLFSLKNKK